MNGKENKRNSSAADVEQELQNKNEMDTEQNTSAQKDGFRYDYDDSSDV
ncbi:hypothetical protein M3175_09045 [Robertmurraya korlensis]|nr:hypothetical protein [Robertmurraya korlensis]MCM3600876.1 hypothetical protein [Robertmurraya korlensis]